MMGSLPSSSDEEVIQRASGLYNEDEMPLLTGEQDDVEQKRDDLYENSSQEFRQKK